MTAEADHVCPLRSRRQLERIAWLDRQLFGSKSEKRKGASQEGPSLFERNPLGKALDYADKMWDRLKRYALDARYQLDNNPVERMQRPTVIGRKNYLFSKNDRGAEDNAIFYTLLESCAIVGVNPLRWLTHALQNLRPDMDEDQLVALLPYNCKAEL